MVRYWIKFKQNQSHKLPIGAKLGYGVTARNEKHALSLLHERVFKLRDLPEIQKITKDVNVSKLDPNHVLPNIGNVFEEGVWFPQGYN